MSEEKRINVSGYAKREYYDNNIEYRNFSPNLVGDQTTSLGSDASIFTRGNFSVTTNVTPKKNKIFKQGYFSEYLTIDSVTENNESILILDKNLKTQLNLDITDPLQYVWYGSFSEFNRVSLEDIQKRWPAAIYVDNKVGSVTGNSVENYSFNTLLNTSTFTVNSKYFYNPFSIIHTLDSNNVVEEEERNDLRNLTINNGKYLIEIYNNTYEVIGFTGSTQKTNSEVKFEVKGNPFNVLTNLDGSALNSEGSIQYFIKPKETEIESFFTSLTEYQRNILNRNTQPIYKSTFDYPVDSETGIIVYQEKTVNFPLTKDGYNLNFFDGLYLSFLSKIDEITNSFDDNQTNLMVRKYTAEVINSFDTIPRGDGDDLINNGQKMTNVLNIYGREFDEVKKYITGIKYAHVVTYDKKNNTPDNLVKDLATMLGFEGFSLLKNLDINKIFLPSNGVEAYSGQTVLTSNKKVETETYRRIILNIAWLWKSKGTRKAVEYLFRLIGAPESVVVFDEYVYVADKPIDIEEVKYYLGKYGVEYDETIFPFDEEGYPKPQQNNSELYFQSFGGWYRRTGGNSPGIDLTEGNNPHVGKYDGGDAYIKQFTDIIPRFSPETNINEVNVVVDNVFKNHNEGIFNGVTNVNNLYLTLLEGRNNQVLTNVMDVEFELEENKYIQPNGTTTAEEGYNIARSEYDRWTNNKDGILKKDPYKRYSPEFQAVQRNYDLTLKKFAAETTKGDCGEDKCLSLTVSKKNIIDDEYKKFRRKDFGPYIYYIDETGEKTYFEDFPERCVSDGGKFKTYENQQGRETVYCAKSAPCSHSSPIGLDENNNVIFKVGGTNNADVDSNNKQAKRTKISSPECCTWYNYNYTIDDEGDVYCVDNEGITESEVMDIEQKIEILRRKKIRIESELNGDLDKVKSVESRKTLLKDLENIDVVFKEQNPKSISKKRKASKSKLVNFDTKNNNFTSMPIGIGGPGGGGLPIRRTDLPMPIGLGGPGGGGLPIKRTDLPMPIGLGGPGGGASPIRIPDLPIGLGGPGGGGLPIRRTDLPIGLGGPGGGGLPISKFPMGGLGSSKPAPISNLRGGQKAPSRKNKPTFNVDTPPVVKGPAGGSPSRAFAVDPPNTLKKKNKKKKNIEKKQNMSVVQNYNNRNNRMGRGLY